MASNGSTNRGTQLIIDVIANKMLKGNIWWYVISTPYETT